MSPDIAFVEAVYECSMQITFGCRLSASTVKRIVRSVTLPLFNAFALVSGCISDPVVSNMMKRLGLALLHNVSARGRS